MDDRAGEAANSSLSSPALNTPSAKMIPQGNQWLHSLLGCSFLGGARPQCVTLDSDEGKHNIILV